MGDETLRRLAGPRPFGDLVAERDLSMALLPDVLTRTAVRWAVYIHDEPFHFAAWFDFTDGSRRVHVSPHVWGADLKRCPSVDYTRGPDERPTPQLQTYLDGLDGLRSRARLVARGGGEIEPWGA